MKMKISKKSLFLVAASVGFFGIVGGVLAGWAVTDEANPTSFKVTIGGNLKTVRFYTSYNGSSWNDYQDVPVFDGGNIDSLDIPGLGISDYTFKGWNPSPLSLTNYSATYTNETLVNLTISQNYELYPVFESDSAYAFTNSTYYDVDTDVTINTNQIGPTQIGKRYYSISGIPNPVATWNDSRNLSSSSGIYKFHNDDGGAQVYRKIGFSTEDDTTSGNVWKASSYNANGRGLWAQAGDTSSDGDNYALTQIDSSERFYAYIPWQRTRYYFKNYSYQQDKKDLESGAINISEGYSATNWVLHKTGDWWNGWTISGNQASWGI